MTSSNNSIAQGGRKWIYEGERREKREERREKKGLLLEAVKQTTYYPCM